MTRQRYQFRAIVLLFFIASGATGLVLEVAWTRILGTVFGNTVYAASTVLTAYMLGMALGSAVLGRVIDGWRRPLLVYGLLELGVGLYALLFPLLAEASYLAYAWFYRTVDPGFALLNVVRFTLSLLLLLPPTFLMGGTLPVLGRHLALRHREPGREIGYLYGANTLGAVAGCFLAGFVLLEALGVGGSFIVAGGVAIGIGTLAVLLGRKEEQYRAVVTAQPDAPQPAQRQSQVKGRKKKKRKQPKTDVAKAPQPVTVLLGESGATFRLVLIAFGITGFCSLAYEVLWTRVLIFVLESSVYSFATMLTAFLAGIAVGSLFSARFLVPRVKRPLLAFGVIEVLVGLSALGSVAVLARLERIDMWLLQYLTFGGRWQFTAIHFAEAMAVLFVPALLMGAAFPMVTTLCLRGKESVGRRTGQVYAANTIGCVLGAFSAGFVLLPILGTHFSLLSVVALNTGVGVAMVWLAGGKSVWGRVALAAPAVGVAVAAFIFTPANVFHDTISAFHYPGKLTYIKEHPTGTVTVHDLPNGERLICVSGVNVAGRDFMLRTTQKLQGYIPLCLHPDPKRVVQIGFGSGETTRVGLEFGVEDYTIVEICPAVFDAGKYFEEINHGSYRDQRLRKIIMDGKNFARLSDEKFDVVMNDSIYPGSSGSSALYTVDHFRNCRGRLAEGGLFSCWLPLDLRPSELRMVLKSFQEVFPHTSFWVASNCLNKHALILGTLTPLQIDLTRLKAVMARPDVAEDLAAITIENVYDLLDCHVLDEAAIREWVKETPLNTDDRPRLEFSCATRPVSEECLKPVLVQLSSRRTPIAPYVVNFPDEEVDRGELNMRFKATNHIFRAQVAQLMGFPDVRTRQLNEARFVNPTEVHIETCEAELRREIRDLEAAFAGRPGNALVALRLANKYYDAERYRESGTLYEQLLTNSAPPPGVFLRLANIRLRQRQTEHAERLLRKCLSLWPGMAEAHDLRAIICLKTGRIGQAKKHIAKAVRLAPKNKLFLKHQEQIDKLGSGRQ